MNNLSLLSLSLITDSSRFGWWTDRWESEIQLLQFVTLPLGD